MAPPRPLPGVVAPPPPNMHSSKKQQMSSWWPVRAVLANRLATAIVVGLIAAAYHIAYHTPTMTPERVAEMWFAADGTATDCPIALAVAMATSQLTCDSGTSYTAVDEGNADRGLFGINSMWHPDVDDECAYDCECSVKAAVRASSSGVGWNKFQKYGNKEYLPFLPMAQAPCNKVLEKMTKKGRTRL